MYKTAINEKAEPVTITTKGCVIMAPALAQTKLYTKDDYYNLPENVHAELVDGQFYGMSAPVKTNIYDDLWIDFTKSKNAFLTGLFLLQFFCLLNCYFLLSFRDYSICLE